MDLNDLKYNYEKLKSQLKEKGAKEIKIQALILFDIGPRWISEENFNQKGIQDYFTGAVEEPTIMVEDFYQLKFKADYSL